MNEINRVPQTEYDAPPGATELIAAGTQLLQIRTQHQLMVAVQRPRDEERFSKKLLTEAASAGEDFYYSIPYKEHRSDCQDRRHCNCPSKPVEGPGVGLTRSAARLWGNCSVEVTIEQDLDDCWIARGWFVDFESNYTRSEVKRISKFKPLKGGKYVKAADKELDVIYQQGASKVERDVVKRALPNSVIEKAFELAKAAALQSKDPIPTQVARLIHKFQEIDVSLAMIETHIKSVFTEDAMRKAQLDPRLICASLRGLLTAIKGGDATVEEVFQLEPANTNSGNGKSKPPISGSVSASDLTGNGKKAPAAPTAEEKPPEAGADPANHPPTAETGPGPATETAGATDPPEEELYRCTVCGWKGARTGRGGRCPKCKAEKEKVVTITDEEPDLSDVKPGEVEKATTPKQDARPGAKPTVRCLSCKREYVERPKVCECGSMLGFKDLK